MTLVNIEDHLILFYQKLSVWNLVLRHMKSQLIIFLNLSFFLSIILFGVYLEICRLVTYFSDIHWLISLMFYFCFLEISFFLFLRYYLFPRAIKKSIELYQTSFQYSGWRYLIFSVISEFIKTNKLLDQGIFFLIQEFRKQRKVRTKFIRFSIITYLILGSLFVFFPIWLTFNNWYLYQIVDDNAGYAFIYLSISCINLLFVIMISWLIRFYFKSLISKTAQLTELIQILENIELARNNNDFSKFIDQFIDQVHPDPVQKIIAENSVEV